MIPAGSRYNSAVSRLLVITGLLALGCGGPAPKPTSAATSHRPAGPVAARPGGPGPAAPAVAREIGCPSPTCALHPGTGRYYTCTSSGAGACTHFGPACTPADACMYDPGDRTYKQCTRASEGSCQAWGQACVPASKCMFDAADGHHRRCDDAAPGTCRRYGALCTP